MSQQAESLPRRADAAVADAPIAPSTGWVSAAVAGVLVVLAVVGLTLISPAARRAT